MSAEFESNPYQLAWLVRRLFRALGQISSENLETAGISYADREVMEVIFPDREFSVPEIAAQYRVTRQHVQATVNSLLKKDLVITKENPRHKRSSLICLNSRGRRLFVALLQQDREALERLFANISEPDMMTTCKTLKALLNASQ